MNSAQLASAACFVQWRSTDAAHRDWRYFPKINFWRDIFPGDLGELLLQSGSGVLLEAMVAPHDLPSVAGAARRSVPREKLQEIFRARHFPGPFGGRFYPRGLLAECGFSDVFSQDYRPFRVTAMSEQRIDVDLGHPLAAFDLTFGAELEELFETGEERGGQCTDLLSEVTDKGPGMQCLPAEGGVDFFTEDAFRRGDESPDSRFYRSPRIVHHIDGRGQALIGRIYARFIEPGARVLDLMSSWVSHLQDVPQSAVVDGLGMNEQELARNPRLAARHLADLNVDPRLPFEDNTYDAVVCSLSVEYLTQPFQVFAEVARVLRPGGHFVVTFSDRWFPPKVVNCWSGVHPFERIALVLEYFRRGGGFKNLGSESYRGWPRPVDDKYHGQKADADPVFAVWGQCA